ncbi:hypothetical protein H9X96_02520 [Pedobacter sp. N36a]|uniref:hypothetical protein n=1 Tax=Pedobacter sp. N36a TaxID=2767996 RepID=UPI001656FC26|nr:hypothetical protein [Pedobacter sp. N36a]MBC8984645.1 hypothetical protein [Pedobacter sp. N36a]
MKQLSLLLFVLFLSACSKEETYGPLKLKDGQEVELLVDHRFYAVDETLIQLPNKNPAEFSLNGFDKRKPGYSYLVKARFHLEKNPLQDASDRWFDFVKVVSEQKYNGQESFNINLIQSFVPGGPTIYLTKEGEKFYYLKGQLQLNYANQAQKGQLEEIWKHAQEIRESETKQQNIMIPKWKSILATVIHDPSNFGNAYLVQSIKLTP